MNTKRIGNRSGMVAVVMAAGCWLAVAGRAPGHCDTAGGPVIPEAKSALEKGDVTPVLKWVKKPHEEEIRTAFALAVAVRPKGPEAQELAERYFLETLVRLHRAGEGATYTGIKDAPADPIVAVADKALAAGSAEDLIRMVSGHMAGIVREKFAWAAEAAKHKDQSVAKGREYVEAYVDFMHYVEGVHAAIAKAPVGHGAAAQQEHAH